MRYRKRPFEVDAWPVPSSRPDMAALPRWLMGATWHACTPHRRAGVLLCVGGRAFFAAVGGWFVLGSKGITAVSGNEFTATYEPIPESEA